jgi:hypothetical protein
MVFATTYTFRFELLYRNISNRMTETIIRVGTESKKGGAGGFSTAPLSPLRRLPAALHQGQIAEVSLSQRPQILLF